MKTDEIAKNLDLLMDRLISKELQYVNIEDKAVMLSIEEYERLMNRAEQYEKIMAAKNSKQER